MMMHRPDGPNRRGSMHPQEQAHYAAKRRKKIVLIATSLLLVLLLIVVLVVNMLASIGSAGQSFLSQLGGSQPQKAQVSQGQVHRVKKIEVLPKPHATQVQQPQQKNTLPTVVGCRLDGDPLTVINLHQVNGDWVGALVWTHHTSEVGGEEVDVTLGAYEFTVIEPDGSQTLNYVDFYLGKASDCRTVTMHL